MKIALPKTLLEPGTIPWEQIRGSEDVVLDVYYTLRGNFADMKKKNVLPIPDDDEIGRIPVYLVKNILRDLALEHGADMARVQHFTIEEIDHIPRYEYRVQYRVGKQVYTRWFG